jgi:hypothetical protein
MSEKLQRNAQAIQDSMELRYDDGLNHKHNKSHKPYRLHQRTHPCLSPNYLNQLDENQELIPNKLTKEFKLRRLRKRENRHEVH